MKETLEECGFIYYLILARLHDVDPKMYQKEGLICGERCSGHFEGEHAWERRSRC